MVSLQVPGKADRQDARVGKVDHDGPAGRVDQQVAQVPIGLAKDRGLAREAPAQHGAFQPT